MDQSALLDLLDLLAALKDTDVTDRVRVATEHLYQELIDAEATAVIGAGPWQRTVDRTAQRRRRIPAGLLRGRLARHADLLAVRLQGRDPRARGRALDHREAVLPTVTVAGVGRPERESITSPSGPRPTHS
jgi:hypothetical protein